MLSMNIRRGRLLKKVILRLVSICVWMHAFAGLIALMVSVFAMENFTISNFIIFAIVIGAFSFLGKYLWDLSSKSTKNDLLIKQRVPVERPKENEGKNTRMPIVVTSKITKEVPEEILIEMKKYYSAMQMEGDLRILDESVGLMRSTMNLDTFIGRYELALRTAHTLEQAQMAGININQAFMPSSKVYDLKEALVPGLLKQSYNQMLIDASKLKTAKGQHSRYEKFLDFLLENEDFFDDFDVYHEVIRSVNGDIVNLKRKSIKYRV